ncbi:ASCH domain-containing protein [Dokdonia sp. Asnod3-C12]|uniref:ASCH domain-containing protein n=1 Tax=Dokdonia sp. Asnod3-C12 TaxID=3160575 RepID=UPI00386C746C
MKIAITVLLLVSIGCKNEATTPKPTASLEELQTQQYIESSVSAMWRNFKQAHPEYANEPQPNADFFHDNKEDANRLAALTVLGKKQASSSLYFLYEKYGVDLPQAGNLQIITDFEGKAQAIIKTKTVDTVAYNDISKTYAILDMGTALNALEQWKKAHQAFFESYTKDSGVQTIDSLLIVCETFETIWTKDNQ